jgi:hypothetical protein
VLRAEIAKKSFVITYVEISESGMFQGEEQRYIFRYLNIVGLCVSHNLLKVVGKVQNFYQRRGKQLLRSYRTIL